MLRRVRVLRCCSEAEIIGNPPMAEPGYRWRVPAGLPVVHVKCSPVRLCHRHSAVRRARCSGRERQNGGANGIAKLFLNAAVDLQVDILRIEWGDAYHHIPRLKGACNGGLVYFHFSPVSHAGVF